MTETFTAVVWKEGEWYVAQCREFEVASQGETKEEALDNLSEALSVHFSVPMGFAPKVRSMSVQWLNSFGAV